MKWFNNFKIRTKLIIGFFCVAVIAALVGYVGITNVNKINNDDTILYENMTVPLARVAEITASFKEVQIGLHEIMLAQSQEEIEKKADIIEAERDQLNKVGEEIKGSLVTKDAIAAYGEFIQTRSVYDPKIDLMINLLKDGRNDEVVAMLNDAEVIAAEEAEHAAIDNLQKIIVNNAKSQSENNDAAGNKAVQTMIIIIAAAVLLAIGLGLWIARGITRPIYMLVKSAEQLAKGDLNINLNTDAKDEVGDLSKSFAKMINAINALVVDANHLVQTAVAGQLDARADVTRHQGEYRNVIEGFNNTLDAVIGPLNVAAEYIERIGKGDTLAKITDDYKGDFNEIKNNINSCIDGLGGLIECCAVLKKMATNDYTSKVEGQYQGLFAETAEEVNKVRERLLRVVEVNVNIAKGEFLNDLQALSQIGKRCEADRLIPSMVTSMENIKRLVDDAQMLAERVIAGKLDTRADASQHQGAYREVIEGVNETLNTVVGKFEAIPSPIMFMDKDLRIQYINLTGANLLSRTKEQLLGVKCADVWHTRKCNTSSCPCARSMNEDGLIQTENDCVINGNAIDLMCVGVPLKDKQGNIIGSFEFVNDQTEITQAARKAQKMNQFQNVEVEKIKEGLARLAKGDLYYQLQVAEGDDDTYDIQMKFGEISEAFKQSIEAIKGLVADANMLAQAAVEGKLDARADASKHGGDFRAIIEGVNHTLDAVIGPLNVAAEYIERIANGNTPPKITDDYYGDFNEIKNNLNTCIDAISAMVDEIGVAIAAGVEGRLDQRANADRCQGVYYKILSGVNATMDALIAPVNEAIVVVEQFEQGLLDIKMTGNYKGDNAKLKDSLNSTMATIADAIGEVSELLGQISNGNLAISIEREYPGDLSAISTAIKHIIESLNEIMGDINHAAEQVANGSEQVSDSSQALAQGANEQASAIEQLTAAITQIAAQTKQNAVNASQANDLALNARDNAAQGNEQMKEMLGAMEDINESSANISKIIKVIDEIAFQTNILALNAAVEAARAGQHGKGFAVVAEEVRNLAARSASAAKETTDLIEGSIRKVQSGTKIANDTAQALNKIVEGVSQAAVLVGDIAVASNEQATGIAQVDQGIGQVSQVVQTNSATAQQSAAASEELSQQAGVLKERVRRFQLRRRKDGFSEIEYKAIKQNPARLESDSYLPGVEEAAAAKSRKAKISLDNGYFGKY